MEKHSRIYCSFNPRTHTGCDNCLLCGHVPISVFQSTHPHGVRRAIVQNIMIHLTVSIHAPTRGATRRPCRAPRLHLSFNPRTHTGCDKNPCNTDTIAGVFQSTHPHGVRPQNQLRAEIEQMFQSTHPHGVRPNGLAVLSVPYLFQSTHPHGVRRKVV